MRKTGPKPEGGLKAPGGPAGLLPPVGVDRDRQLLRDDQVFDVGGPPAAQLRAVAEVQVLGQRPRAPAARVQDRGPAPHPGRAGEVGEIAVLRPHRLLDQEVKVDRHRLQPSEQRVALVEMTPTRLRECDRGVVECADRPPQKIRRRDEVGVEDGDEGRIRLLHAVGESAGLESGAGGPAQLRHADSLAAPVRHPSGEDLDRLVVRVVENLDLKPIVRPVDRADRIEDPLDNVALVVDGDLHADARFAGGGKAPRRGRPQPHRAHGEVQEVESKGEQEQARRRHHRHGDHGDQPASKSV